MNCRTWIVLIVVVGLAVSGWAVEMQFDHDRISLRVEREPLTNILARFAEKGVRVQYDPSIDVLVTGSCGAAPVEEALAALLEPFAYAAIWEVVPGPLGEWPRLAELHVFRPGEKERIRPLQPENVLRVVQGPFPDSPLIVADELLVRVARGVRAEEFRNWLRSVGASIVASVPSLGVYQLRVAPGVNIFDLVERANRNPLIESAEPNFATPLPRADFDSPMSKEALVADSPAKPLRGAPPLAILDSGVRDELGIGAWVVGRFNAMAPDREPVDPLGHGTQMALLASGMIRPTGSLPSDEGLPILAIRAFDDRGVTSNFAILRAIDYAVRQGARVLNLSWGTPTHSPFLEEAIAYAQAKGLVVVAAAGNEPTGRPVYPAAYKGVIAVSALASKGDLWENSNRGDFVTVAAPGAAVMPIGYQGPAGLYAGTSIASAWVAREIALFFARNPGTTAQQAIDALRAAVTDAGKPGRDERFGFGVLDAGAQARLRGRSESSPTK
ncbi:MAG: S8 family serine peptidase [Kiritimatiellae bacterium]|nr:S8 family serine peptidase [Kiritimatiellia bacterium]MDW8457991.1 S8 family serine peptidase [Verrucomicrobiota bacterium]